MNDNHGYKHLERRPGSNYKQLFAKGIRIRANVLYCATLGEDAMTPEEVAQDYHLPLELVLEAIDYCKRYPEEIQRDLDMEEEKTREFELRYPPILPPDHLINK